MVPPEECCYFRGSMASLDIRSGAVQWKTYTLPDNGGKLGGYAGGAIWGSSPAIDLRRQLVYVATGNLYSAPANVTECQERQEIQTTVPTEPDQCIAPDVNFNSIIAFDMGSGRIRWARQLGGYDIWYMACSVSSNLDCPPGLNEDADFGEAPMMLSILYNGRRRDIAVAVQKSGFAWALDRDTGDIVWSRVSMALTSICNLRMELRLRLISCVRFRSWPGQVDWKAEGSGGQPMTGAGSTPTSPTATG